MTHFLEVAKSLQSATIVACVGEYGRVLTSHRRLTLRTETKSYCLVACAVSLIDPSTISRNLNWPLSKADKNGKLSSEKA